MKQADPHWYEFRNAVYARDYPQAEALLAKHPELLHLMDPMGETVLHFLAVENDLDGVKWLHSKGSDLNSTNLFGTPLIFEVAQVASEELFAWLVQNGANPNARDRDGEDIFEHLERYELDGPISWVRKYVA